MPTAVARKIEWFIRSKKPEIDFKLFDVVLTYEQCLKYKLPRKPIASKNEKYQKNFEEKYGEGATELDALEAVHPGELANILTEAMSPYYDESLKEEIADFQDREIKRFEEYQEDVIAEIIDGKRKELKPLTKEYNKLIGKANKVGAKIEELMDDIDVDCDFEPEYPEPSSLMVVDEKTPVLDTQLAYEEQLERYRNGNQ